MSAMDHLDQIRAKLDDLKADKAKLMIENERLRTVMARIKFLEIRDKGTFIPAVAIDCSMSGNSFDDYLLSRAGYGSTRCILLTSLQGGREANYDPYDWGDRTWKIAHHYIEAHWDEIADAEVIDVEFILGESTQQKDSERYTEPLIKFRKARTGRGNL